MYNRNLRKRYANLSVSIWTCFWLIFPYFEVWLDTPTNFWLGLNIKERRYIGGRTLVFCFILLSNVITTRRPHRVANCFNSYLRLKNHDTVKWLKDFSSLKKNPEKALPKLNHFSFIFYSKDQLCDSWKRNMIIFKIFIKIERANLCICQQLWLYTRLIFLIRQKNIGGQDYSMSANRH